MFGRERKPDPDVIEVTIGPRATFDGHLRCDGSIRIEGVMEGGSIETLGNVVITASAKVMADIKARTVSISGAYKGEIDAHRVELLEGGRAWGRIKVASFLLDEGAYLRGELVMQEETPPEPFVLPRGKEPIPVVSEAEGQRG
ncbi:MAG: polymer-forming cytoskeletal protein [Caldilineales bacterium]|nr:polymer-forming cytoskeletal protein [Caldilineales bacterium]MDW8317547.1 polymer-forming cytoskeletal protein [Anaerolineae bacterium]